jgi:hypothetical protein
MTAHHRRNHDRNAGPAHRELLVTPPKLITAAQLEREQEQGRQAPAPAPSPMPAAPSASSTVAVAISAIYDGWPVVISATLAPARIPAYLARLAERGYVRPPTPIPRSANGEPLCEKHNVFMTEHEKQGDTWYSHKIVDSQGRECWCKGRPGGDSPGFAVP